MFEVSTVDIIICNVLIMVGHFLSASKDYGLAKKVWWVPYVSFAANCIYFIMNILLNMWVGIPFNIYMFYSNIRVIKFWRKDNGKK